MKWRTDKPTANVIVAKIDGHYLALRKYADNYYTDDTARNFIPYYKLVRWADLEEDETVTDCNELEKEINNYFKYWTEDECTGAACHYQYVNLNDCRAIARHFAKWGAEHLKS